MFKSNKLKDARTCRIFFSSPFGGMEEEREELTRKYFPQIHHLCNERGVEFVPVDMRWGITEESAQNGQVLNICLREIDRSDIFVGFFGQRYGWHCAHGTSFGLLQKNFDHAAVQYPWVDGYHGCSMTEVEFLHGHLNTPGHTPSCIGFRAKTFDDAKHRLHLDGKDERSAAKYVSEGEQAVRMLDGLKTRVRETADSCLAIDMEYKHPHDFARLVFEAVRTYLDEILRAETDLTVRAAMRIDHDNFMVSARQVYIGGDNYFQQLDQYTDEGKCVFVSGPAGSGKSALLSNWVNHLSKLEKEHVVIYHFIGCGENSSNPLNISLRLRLEAEHALQVITEKHALPRTEQEQCEQEKIAEESSTGDRAPTDGVREHLDGLRSAVEHIVAQSDKTLVIVVDAVEKAVDDSGKVTKPLYWLPEGLPKGVVIVASSLDTNTTAHEELVAKRQYHTLHLQPLSKDMKHEICVNILQNRGKQFSAEQLQKVVNSEQTSNPLFLTITIHELSVFGYFRKLDEKIESLLACQSIQQLFNKYLDRMEEDYNVAEYPGNLVQTVLSAVCVAHVGLTETELQEAFNIHKQEFSPLYFALEKFIISHSGPIWFAFSELKDAIRERYLQTEGDRLLITRKLINFFEQKRKAFCITMHYQDTSTIRPAYELPWLQKLVDDKAGLSRSLTDLFIFSRLYQERDYELLELWKSTGCSFMECGEMFEREFDLRLVEYYELYREGGTPSRQPPGVEMLIFLEQMQDFLELALCQPASIQISQRIINILNNVENVDSYDEVSRQKKLANHKYQLACSYCDMERYSEGMALHQEVLHYYKKALGNGDLERVFAETRIAWCYNGMGLIARFLGQLDHAKELLQQSHDIHDRLGNKKNMADSLQNLGLVALDSKQFDAAIQLYKHALEIYEDKFFGFVPHTIGNLFTNLGLCYRRKNDLVSAEKYYLESLRVKANAVGWDHPIIAINYMNLGTLEMFRKNWKASEDYAKKCIEIYKINLYPEDDYHHRRALENLLMAWMMMNRYDDEAQEMYWRLFNILVSLSEMDNCLSGVHHRMAKFCLDSGRLEEADQILTCVMRCRKRNKTTYLHMDELDSRWPDGHKPDRPVEMTLSYAMENLYPGSSDLKKRMLEKYLIPREDVAGIIDLLHDGQTDRSSDHYLAIADHCTGQLKAPPRLGVAILVDGLRVCPDSQQIVLQLINIYHDNKQFKEAFPYVLGIMEEQYSKFKQEAIVSRFSNGKQCEDIVKAESSDIVKAESSDIVKAESSDIVKAESSDIVKAESSDIVKAESSDIAKAESSDIVKAESSDIVKAESSDIVKTDGVKEVEDKDETAEELRERNQFLASSYLKCGNVAAECGSKPVAEHFFNKVITTRVREFVKLTQEAVEKYEVDVSDASLEILLELACEPAAPVSQS